MLTDFFIKGTSKHIKFRGNRIFHHKKIRGNRILFIYLSHFQPIKYITLKKLN